MVETRCICEHTKTKELFWVLSNGVTYNRNSPVVMFTPIDSSNERHSKILVMSEKEFVENFKKAIIEKN